MTPRIIDVTDFASVGDMTARRLMRPGCLSLLMVLTACGLYDRHQQIRTIVTMRAIATYLGDAIDSGKGSITEAAMRRTIDSVEHGKDAWGTPFAFRLNRINGRTSYVLVSAGSDGSFDVPDIGDYFRMAVHDTKSDPRRDLVIRDGELITLAGK
jgi:hypothetical protein